MSIIMRNTLKILLVIFVVALVPFHCEASNPSHAPHWGYEGDEGPGHWGDLDHKFALCKTGTVQSPIDISHTVKKDLGDIEFDYENTPLKIVNNGHTIQVNYTSDSFIRTEGKTYKLLQFHFHSPSENTHNESPYVMEAHLVHKNEHGQLAVVGIFLKEGAHNPFLQAIWDNIPGEVNKEKTLRQGTRKK